MKDEKYLEEKLGLPPDQVKYVMEHLCLYEEGVPRNELTCERYREMGRNGCPVVSVSTALYGLKPGRTDLRR